MTNSFNQYFLKHIISCFSRTTGNIMCYYAYNCALAKLMGFNGVVGGFCLMYPIKIVNLILAYGFFHVLLAQILASSALKNTSLWLTHIIFKRETLSRSVPILMGISKNYVILIILLLVIDVTWNCIYLDNERNNDITYSFCDITMRISDIEKKRIFSDIMNHFVISYFFVISQIKCAISHFL